jgi:hypothetical protein
VQNRTGEKYDLVLLRHDCLVAAGLVAADWRPTLPARVVETKLSAREGPRLAMEEINERQTAGCDSLLRIIAMRMKEVAVVAGSDLQLGLSDGKLLHTELLEHLRQHTLNTPQKD